MDKDKEKDFSDQVPGAFNCYSESSNIVHVLTNHEFYENGSKNTPIMCGAKLLPKYTLHNLNLRTDRNFRRCLHCNKEFKKFVQYAETYTENDEGELLASMLWEDLDYIRTSMKHYYRDNKIEKILK